MCFRGGGSAEYGQRPYFKKKKLDPSLMKFVLLYTIFKVCKKYLILDQSLCRGAGGLKSLVKNQSSVLFFNASLREG